MGHCLNQHTSLIKTARTVVKRHGIPNIELIRTYLGLFTLGRATSRRQTKIVYWKSEYNRRDYPVIAFDFLSYTFRPRLIRNQQGQKKVYFTAAISQSAAKEIRKQINEWPWKWWRQKDLGQFARFCQSRLRGWMHYYRLFGRSYIRNVLFHFDLRLSRWAVGKYRKLRGLLQAARRVNGLRRRRPTLFAHWAGSRAMVG